MEISKHDYKYQRLVNMLEREIHLNYAPGERFPPELELCEHFGTYVADFDEAGFDNRLVCAGMALRSHMWDRLFLSLSYQAGLNEKFLLAVDLGDHKFGEWESKRLSDSESFRRVKRGLSWHPRSLIADFDIQKSLPKLGNERWHFRNLVLLRPEHEFPHLPHVARVVPDRAAAYSLMSEAALKAGYKRLCRFGPPLAAVLDQPTGDELKNSPFFSEHGGLEGLIKHVRNGEPAAVMCDYDYGAHLVLQRLKQEGIAVPEQAGLIGFGNTPWAFRDDLTTISFDNDLWAGEIFQCLQRMEESDEPIESLIPPQLVERSSTIHVKGKEQQRKSRPSRSDFSILP